ncbi:MarR family transcriptional regulator [Clostridium carboxidivorans P7]|uniref:Transcriptional regulator, MarR family n=1 Tax=Clostridium carboxidivorans P7 TaxID=536227 RepID=C6PVC1_9CLOT|nr:MarR family transcriptional regulator [Clostridium carboxidivorans]AKN30703.1 MarR family transcriptional regulator [Clostridium carboxidivorans P7]EET86851.1 transcriptional regulator, MarR family [Clostridium carboxidivorans P7]
MTVETEKKLDDIKALFYFAYKTFTEEPDHMLVKYGIQRMHHRILYFVARFPGISINELLTLLEISKQALNSPLRKLIEKGFITSVPSKQDLRVRQLTLTKEGKELEKKLSYVQSRVLKNIFNELGEDCLISWIKVMEKFAASRPGNDLWCSKKGIE